MRKQPKKSTAAIVLSDFKVVARNLVQQTKVTIFKARAAIAKRKLEDLSDEQIVAMI